MDNSRDRAVRRLTSAGDEDMQVAGLCLQTEPLACRAAAFHAQQAAEKHINACLIAFCVDDPPITHNLPRIAELLAAQGGPELPAGPLRFLTGFAVATRYGQGEVSPVDARRAVDEARRIVTTCREAGASNSES